MKNAYTKGFCLLLALIMIFSSVSVSSFALTSDEVSSLKAAQPTDKIVTLSWSKISSADGYAVYRKDATSSKWVNIKKTAALTYTDKSLKPGSVYYYGVRPIDTADGKYIYGTASNIVKVLTRPAELSNLKLTNTGKTFVSLKWDKAEGATGYGVYMYSSAAKKYNLVSAVNGTEYTVNNLNNNTTYTFAVRAYTKNGTVVYGTEKYIKTTTLSADALEKVLNLRLDAFNEKAYRIKWDAVEGADGYQVAIYDTTAKKWKSLGATTKTQAVLNAANRSDNYRYVVRAVAKTAKGYTYGALSDAIYAFAKPETPTGLQGAENSSYGVSLKWNKVAGAAGYEIYTYDVINGKWVFLSTSTVNTYNVKGLTQTSHYKYKVRAYKISSGKKFYGDFCESITVNFHAEENDSPYSEELEKSGIFGYLYNPDQNYFYTADDPWQRNVGYNSIFDTTAPLTFIDFDTVRLRFPYGDKDWMIQLWKGQYGLIFYGAEAGVYTKPKDRVLMHYDCATDDEMLKMSMVFNEYKNGSWQQRFTRPYGYYWWCTGFIPGNKLGDFSVLKLDMRITAKDYDMLRGLKGALEENNISYTVSGLDVYFTFS